jgi:hypothetical protein
LFPVYPNVMLEEVLQSYANPVAREQLVGQWLPMILATAPRLCADLVTIFRRELVMGRGAGASIFMKRAEETHIREQLQTLPLDGSWSLMHETEEERKTVRETKLARRATSLEMRGEVAKKARALGTKIESGLVPQGFHPTHSELVEFMGRRLVERFVSTTNADRLIREWLRRRERYPFFTQFAEDVVFQELHFMTNHDSKVDVNAQPDLEILAHLLQADVVVTNETGFMKEAFTSIWKPRGKMLLDCEQFAWLLERRA